MSKPATIIPRSEHSISRSNINAHALRVLYRLRQAGYGAFLVGGCVRDMLLQRHPKDFDVVTNAHPEEIRGLFGNCRLIGRRFRLAHILYGREVIEVATFRGYVDTEDDRLNAENGRILRDNAYGDIHEDVWRRDFTVNALYYNIADFSLIDYVGALDDLRKGVIRLIGDPAQRYREDPVRMLRAVRFAAKLGFEIEPNSATPISEMAALLKEVPPARLFDEVLKLFHTGHAVESFRLLRHHGLLQYLFPHFEQALSAGDYPFTLNFVEQALRNTDLRIQQEKPVTPAFLFAAFLWPPLMQAIQYQPEKALMNSLQMQKAAASILVRQCRHIMIPRRLSAVMREIWLLQVRLQRSRGRRALVLLSHPRFRAAYDFLCLRAQTGENVQTYAEWWTQIQEKNSDEQLEIVTAMTPGQPGKRRLRMRRRGKKKA